MLENFYFGINVIDTENAIINIILYYYCTIILVPYED